VAVLLALTSPIEALERRLLLSVDVSAAALETPLFTVGSRWTYDLTASGSTGTVVRTVIGYTTLSNGLEEWEIDQTTPGVSGVEKTFYGLDAAGDYVTYGNAANASGYSSTDTYSPPLINLPAEIAQGIAYSFSATDTSTRTNPSGMTTTSTGTKTTTVTLASDTPSDMTTDAGTYSVYQVTTANGTGNSNVQYDSPQIGLVELVTSGTVNSTLLLTNFETNHDNLSFANIPTTVVPPGTAIQPPITVEIRDNTGTLDTDATGTVTLALNSASRLGTSPGILGGATTEPIVDGEATFSNLTVSAAGSYTLTASDSAGDTPVTSNQFSVGGLGLSLTALGVNPKGANSGDVISFKLLVSPKQTIDSQQLVVTLPTGFTASGVTGGGTPPNGNTITWTASTLRLAEFNVKVPGANVISQLSSIVVSAVDDVTYSDGATDQGAATSTVPLAVPQLKVKAQPPSTVDALTPIPLTIELVNDKGQLDTGENTAQVQLSLQVVSGSSSATLGGNTLATFVNGIATFAGSNAPTINGAGTYKLVATEVGTDTPPASVESNEIKVTGLHIKFLEEPTDTAFDAGIPFEIAIVDAKGNVDTDYDSAVVSLSGKPQGPSYSQKSFSNGTITFPAALTNALGQADGAATITTLGTYTITASAINADGSPIPEIAPATSKPFDITPLHIEFTKQPVNSTIGGAIPFTLALKDADGKTDTTQDQSVVTAETIALSSAPAGGLSYSTEHFDAGVHTYPSTTSDFMGYGTGAATLGETGDFTLTANVVVNGANVANILPATSNTFKILPQHLAFEKQPADVAAAYPIPAFEVASEDADGQIVTGGAKTIQIAYQPVGSTSTPIVFGTATTDPSTGIATFSLLHIPTSGKYRLIATQIDPGIDALPATSVEITIT
jgi:hypothetical protein